MTSALQKALPHSDACWSFEINRKWFHRVYSTFDWQL